MKKLITVFILCAGMGICVAQAHEGFHHGGYYRGGYYGGNWVAPALIGGVIGYELSRPRYYEPPVVVQQPVIVQQQPVYTVTPQPNCTLWVETQHSDGTITSSRTCTQ
jgi:hypothetical protein